MSDVQTPPRVLLVDDDVDFCRDLAALLGGRGSRSPGAGIAG